MGHFEAKVEVSGVENVLTISGRMDENSELPAFLDQKNIRVKLGKLQNISSHGVNAWCKWLALHQKIAVIYLEECPHIFVRTCSILEQFITPNVKIESFYVPYFNEKSEEAKSILFVRDRDFGPDGKVKFPEVLDSRGNKMELDVVVETYFKFLT